MNEMMIFNNHEFGSVRTVCIDGAPWLVGKDVAEILGYGHSMSVSDVVEICEGKNSGFYFVDSIGFKRLDDFDLSQTDREDLMKCGHSGK